MRPKKPSNRDGRKRILKPIKGAPLRKSTAQRMEISNTKRPPPHANTIRQKLYYLETGCPEVHQSTDNNRTNPHVDRHLPGPHYHPQQKPPANGNHTSEQTKEGSKGSQKLKHKRSREEEGPRRDREPCRDTTERDEDHRRDREDTELGGQRELERTNGPKTRVNTESEPQVGPTATAKNPLHTPH